MLIIILLILYYIFIHNRILLYCMLSNYYKHICIELNLIRI